MVSELLQLDRCRRSQLNCKMKGELHGLIGWHFQVEAAACYRSQKWNTILLGERQKKRAVGTCLWMGGGCWEWAREKECSCINNIVVWMSGWLLPRSKQKYNTIIGEHEHPFGGGTSVHALALALAMEMVGRTSIILYDAWAASRYRVKTEIQYYYWKARALVWRRHERSTDGNGDGDGREDINNNIRRR